MRLLYHVLTILSYVHLHFILSSLNVSLDFLSFLLILVSPCLSGYKFEFLVYLHYLVCSFDFCRSILGVIISVYPLCCLIYTCFSHMVFISFSSLFLYFVHPYLKSSSHINLFCNISIGSLFFPQYLAVLVFFHYFFCYRCFFYIIFRSFPY